MLEKILRFRRPITVLMGGGLALAFIASANAQSPEDNAASIEDLIAAIDQAWLMIAAFMVFFMPASSDPRTQSTSS